MNMRVLFWTAVLVFVVADALPARDLQAKPADAFFARYEVVAAPAAGPLMLQSGDRLAICGDSITEQRQYSVLIETYLAACLPHLGVSVRQFGWSGEQASGFKARMKNDVLRFKPTVATTCYGMNDHRYVPYSEEIGAAYRENLTAVARNFREAGVRLILGSPGTIDSVPPWVKSAAGTKEDLNESLCRLRNIGIEVAVAEKCRFADVWWPMMLATAAARQIGPDFAVSGKDGVHPDWAGQVVMAAAFLQAMGVDGSLGIVNADMATRTVTASPGHSVSALLADRLEITSRVWPFSPPPEPLDKDDSIRAGMALCDFDQRFNRLILKVTSLGAASADITWGSETKRFSAAELEAGVNLASAFPVNPFSEPFSILWGAVAAKQEYETRQVKTLMHGPEGAVDMEGTVALSESVRGRRVEAIQSAHHPVMHTVIIRPAP